MVKRLDPNAHALMDYGSVVGLLVLPSWLGLRGKARTAALTVASSTLTVTALTAFPLTLARVITYRVHGALELGSAATLFALPWLAGFSDDCRGRYFFLALGMFVTAVWGMTDWQADTVT